MTGIVEVSVWPFRLGVAQKTPETIHIRRSNMKVEVIEVEAAVRQQVKFKLRLRLS